MKSLLSFGHRIGYRPFDVGRPVRLPRIKDTIAERILPEDTVLAMITLEPGQRNRALLRLLYGAGLRVSELCGLRWRDFQERDDSAQVTVFGKGGRTRHVLLSVGTRSALDEAMQAKALELQQLEKDLTDLRYVPDPEWTGWVDLERSRVQAAIERQLNARDVVPCLIVVDEALHALARPFHRAAQLARCPEH